jgi:hypothetical protein
MTMERYPNPNGGVGVSIPNCDNLLSTWQAKPRAHPPQGRQYTPPYIKENIEQGRANGLKFTLDCLTLYIIIIIIIIIIMM